MSDIQDTSLSSPKPTLKIMWLAAAIVVLDQVTKLLIKGVPFLGIEGFPYGHSTPFIGDIFRLTYIENPGIAFGIHIPAMKVFFSLFSIIASIGIFIYLKRKIAILSKWETLGLVLILGGAIGNLIDRCFYGVLYGEEALFYGRVVDFIDFGYKENWWPIFNVADSAVSVGVTILAITLLTKKQPAVSESSTTATKVAE
ncbi:MAG TPA: signal peptidase II [Candidatus Kapabacteria bacterium]